MRARARAFAKMLKADVAANGCAQCEVLQRERATYRTLAISGFADDPERRARFVDQHLETILASSSSSPSASSSSSSLSLSSSSCPSSKRKAERDAHTDDNNDRDGDGDGDGDHDDDDDDEVDLKGDDGDNDREGGGGGGGGGDTSEKDNVVGRQDCAKMTREEICLFPKLVPSMFAASKRIRRT